MSLVLFRHFSSRSPMFAASRLLVPARPPLAPAPPLHHLHHMRPRRCSCPASQSLAPQPASLHRGSTPEPRDSRPLTAHAAHLHELFLVFRSAPRLFDASVASPTGLPLAARRLPPPSTVCTRRPSYVRLPSFPFLSARLLDRRSGRLFPPCPHLSNEDTGTPARCGLLHPPRRRAVTDIISKDPVLCARCFPRCISCTQTGTSSTTAQAKVTPLASSAAKKSTPLMESDSADEEYDHVFDAFDPPAPGIGGINRGGGGRRARESPCIGQ
ncbi:hypothetical protein B0H11DRAFT_2214118 [Mycena galericulata]|nr:hypothetical protein B0H11DRAFT_2214118 [Mycena galericulata]